MADAPPRRERSLRALAWATLPVTLLGLWVQVTGAGIDLFVIALIALGLLGMERTLGDWLAELLGPALAGIVFAVCIAGLVLYFVADAGGKSRARRFFNSAQERGYTTVYLYTPEPAEPDAALHTSVASTPAVAPSATTGVSQTSGVSEATDGGAPRSVPAARDEPGGAGPARSLRRGTFRLPWASSARPAPAATAVSLSISTASAAPGKRVTLRASVSSGGVAVTTGDVEFTVGGLGAGRIPLSAAGTASTGYSTHIPGLYEVQARYSGTAAFAASLSPAVTFTVRAVR